VRNAPLRLVFSVSDQAFGPAPACLLLSPDRAFRFVRSRQGRCGRARRPVQ